MSGTAALSAYRVLPRRVGWGYLFASSLGRLPVSMVPLAILTLATSATGSIAVGGVAASATAVAEAIGGPLGGALADRFGQRTVLLVGVAVNVAIAIAFMVGVGVLPDPVAVVLAGATGLTLPQVGPLSRARWLAVAPEDGATAFAFEGVVDEIVYIVGPSLVGIVAVAVSPAAAMLVSVAFIAVFVTWFAVHPTAVAVPRRGAAGQVPAEPIPARAIVLTVLAFAGMVSMGTFFGGSQTALTAFAQSIGIPDAGALLYAAMAVGSAVTTMAMVALPDRIGVWTRWVLAATGLLAGALAMLAAGDLVSIVLAAVLAGAFQGPLLLTVFTVAGSVAVAGRTGIMLTFTASGVVLGVGVGTAAGGVAAAAGGATGAFLVVLAATTALVALGLVAAATSRRRAARREA